VIKLSGCFIRYLVIHYCLCNSNVVSFAVLGVDSLASTFCVMYQGLVHCTFSCFDSQLPTRRGFVVQDSLPGVLWYGGYPLMPVDKAAKQLRCESILQRLNNNVAAALFGVIPTALVKFSFFNG
jgi:hypothetical protein